MDALLGCTNYTSSLRTSLALSKPKSCTKSAPRRNVRPATTRVVVGAMHHRGSGRGVPEREKRSGFVEGENEKNEKVGSEEEEEEEEEELAQELESLEEEAIGGKDEGREPLDYDRRARIFDESSRVFRGIKKSREQEVREST